MISSSPPMIVVGTQPVLDVAGAIRPGAVFRLPPVVQVAGYLVAASRDTTQAQWKAATRALRASPFRHAPLTR